MNQEDFTKQRTLMGELNLIKNKIPWNTYSTIRSQIRVGNYTAAEKGIRRIRKWA